MLEQKIPSKSAIEKAVLLSLANSVKLERKPLISKSIEKHGFSPEIMKDRSCESLSTELKSLTGVVLNEMISKKMLLNEGNLYFAPEIANAVIEENNNNVKGEPKPPVKKKRRHKKVAEKGDLKNPAVENTVLQKVYPDTALGKILSDANKKFLDFKNKKIVEPKDEKQKAVKQSYIYSLKKLITVAINTAGGEFFEELSMKLLLACYGDSVVKNELTGGPEDNGIDGIITVKDDFGFEEKIYFQAKTKISERKNVSIKVARELLGVMTADKVSKGIVITNSSFVRDTKIFAAKVPHLALVDLNQLFDMMCKYSIGIKEQDGISRIDDELFSSI
ncbi:MAG TPA: restriction endonuclease [Clostridia bacterium]|nr:restriction endonuclease [Clostridia bacterium]